MKSIPMSARLIDSSSGNIADSIEREIIADPISIFRSGGTWFGYVPPLSVLNQYFEGGVANGTLQGQRVLFEWVPFQLNQKEYHAFVDMLKALQGSPYEDDRSIPEEDWSHYAPCKAIDREEERNKNA